MAHKSPARRGRSTSLERLAPFEDDCVLVVIETPKGSPNKLTFEPRYGTFVLKGVLPAGAVFPFDFGFVPSTRADDGDPLDVLVLMDAPVYPGCIVPSRLIGVIEAEQTEEGADRAQRSTTRRRGELRRTPVDPPVERSQRRPRRANRTLLRLVQRDEGQTFRSTTARWQQAGARTRHGRDEAPTIAAWIPPRNVTEFATSCSRARSRCL